MTDKNAKSKRATTDHDPREHGEKLNKPVDRVLTEADARMVRMSTKRTYTLANELGVSYDRVRSIRNGFSFRAVAREVPLCTVRDPVRRRRNNPNAGMKGSKHGRARLHETDIPTIRASDEPQIVLAQRYGVHVTAISHVVTRRNWRHVPETE